MVSAWGWVAALALLGLAARVAVVIVRDARKHPPIAASRRRFRLAELIDTSRDDVDPQWAWLRETLGQPATTTITDDQQENP